MAEIDIQMTFDAVTIFNTYKGNSDPNNPVEISANFVYMVTNQGNVVTGEGGGELNVSAQTDDVLRWREATLNPEYSVLLYAFTPQTGLISPPQPLQSTITVPVPNAGNPLQPGRQTIQDYFWESTVLNPGTLTYHFRFMIVNRAGAELGYYSWDPFITINS